VQQLVCCATLTLSSHNPQCGKFVVTGPQVAVVSHAPPDQSTSFMGTPWQRPDLGVRFGRALLLQRSLRRPVAAGVV
jgi:hypothetical protein